MTVVQSGVTLMDMPAGWWPTSSYGRLRMYNQYSYDYATIYRTQPNVRTCVDFLARNIAQLGLHVFRRVSDMDRQRLRDHRLAQVLGRPLPPEFKVTYYRLIEALMGDLGVYFNAFWLKIKVEGAPVGLLRVPPPLVTVKGGGLVPTGYEVVLGGRMRKIAPAEIVHFRGYNAENAVIGLSPLETLRRVLAEEYAMGNYREYFWQNAARMHGIIKRPRDAPEWSGQARQRFKAEWEALYSGDENSGKTAILEEGMEWEGTSFDAQQSEYLGGRKLTREECARAYHIPLPMVGILDHATFSNIKEQHKQLYQDALGPWLAMIEQDVELQLLPEFGDTAGVYCEFNIAEKLQGSFEEQTTALQSAVGRPWMTADEARARFNMPSMGGDAERLVTPLNVLVGGMASPRDVGKGTGGQGDKGTREQGKSGGEVDPTLLGLRERHREKWTPVLVRTFERQRSAVVGRLKVKAQVADVWDAARWDAELGADLYRLNYATATVWAEYVAEQIGSEVDGSTMEGWLLEHARVQAEYINAATLKGVDEALVEEDPLQAVRDLFAAAIGVRAWLLAGDGVTAAANFGAHDAARQGGLRRKTWRVTSSNPRPSHLAMDGVSVDIGGLFPNGGKWPGDPALGADENAGCQCVVTFGR